MTPKSLSLHMDAFFWRKDQFLVPLSVFTAAIVSPHVKKPPKPRDLYRPHSAPSKPELTREEREARFQRAVAMMGPDVIPVISMEELRRRKEEKKELEGR